MNSTPRWSGQNRKDKIMAKKRIRKVLPDIRSREEMERLVGEIAALKNQQTQAQAEIDARILRIREEREVELSALAEQLDEKTEMSLRWAAANSAEFGARKSIVMTHGTVGFRTGNPKLKPVTKFTWAKVLETIQRSATFARSYIRTKPEVDREKLLADRDDLGVDGLKLLGLKVVQEESFFVEPHLSSVENREQREAA